MMENILSLNMANGVLCVTCETWNYMREKSIPTGVAYCLGIYAVVCLLLIPILLIQILRIRKETLNWRKRKLIVHYLLLAYVAGYLFVYTVVAILGLVYLSMMFKYLFFTYIMLVFNRKVSTIDQSKRLVVCSKLFMGFFTIACLVGFGFAVVKQESLEHATACTNFADRGMLIVYAGVSIVFINFVLIMLCMRRSLLTNRNMRSLDRVTRAKVLQDTRRSSYFTVAVILGELFTLTIYIYHILFPTTSCELIDASSTWRKITWISFRTVTFLLPVLTIMHLFGRAKEDLFDDMQNDTLDYARERFISAPKKRGGQAKKSFTVDTVI